MGLRQSHSALTLPSDDAYASAAPDANKAKLFQALRLSKLSNFKYFAAASVLPGQASLTDSIAADSYLALPSVADDARAALDNCHA